MANNPYVNKVMKSDGTTIMDISDSTVVAEALKEGFTAYNAAGKKITGAIPLTSWEQLQQKVRTNDMADISIDDQYGTFYQNKSLLFDVIGKNIDTPANPNLSHALTLRVHNLLPDLVFDAKEAFYACQDAPLPAGTYYFKGVYQSKNYTFTLTQPVPIGGQLVCTDVNTLYTIDTYASCSSTTPIETVNLTNGSSGTYLGALANYTRSGNLNMDIRRRNGSTDWRESAIRQWLNSDKPAGQWWEPQNPWDRPPAYAETANGFLYDLDPDFLNVIGKTQVITKYYDATTGSSDTTYTTEDYFFLMSLSQVSSDYSGEGAKYTPYSDNASRVMYLNGSASYYWLRTFGTKNYYNVDNVCCVLDSGSTGDSGYSRAYGASAVALVCNII